MFVFPRHKKWDKKCAKWSCHLFTNTSRLEKEKGFFLMGLKYPLLQNPSFLSVKEIAVIIMSLWEMSVNYYIQC